jgi:hypothetical protein
MSWDRCLAESLFDLVQLGIIQNTHKYYTCIEQITPLHVHCITK